MRARLRGMKAKPAQESFRKKVKPEMSLRVLRKASMNSYRWEEERNAKQLSAVEALSGREEG